MKALILAAGLGSRLSLDIPKPMYKINGKPVLEHNIDLLKVHGIKTLFINTHFKHEVIEDHFKDGSGFNVDITYSYEESLLGTSGALKKLEKHFKHEKFFVVYGDNYTNINLTEMLEFHDSNSATATIAVFDPNKVLNSKIAGGLISLDEENNVISFEEGKKDTTIGYVNAGVYILEPEVLDIIPNGVSDFGKNIFPELLKLNKNIKGYSTSGFVYAIDTADALRITQEEIK